MIFSCLFLCSKTFPSKQFDISRG